MKKYAYWGFILMLVLVFTLAGCGGGGGSKTTGPETAVPRYFAYTMHSDGKISVFSINSSGALSPVSSLPTGYASSDSSLAADKSGKFLYVAQYTGSNGVSVYSIHPTTGALSPVADSPFTTDSNPKKVAVDPTGNFVAVGCRTRLNLFSRDQTTGKLSVSDRLDFSFASGQELGAISFDRTGQFLYIAVSTGDIYVYEKDAGSNTFTQFGNTYETRTSPTSMAFNPSSSHLFVSTSSTTAIPIHPVKGDGSLDGFISLNIGAQSHSLIIDGDYIYIAKFTGLSAYSIANPDSIAQIGTTLSLGTVMEPNSLAFDPTRNFLYVTAWDSKKIWVFARNSTNGSLTAISESTFETDANISSIVTVKTTN